MPRPHARSLRVLCGGLSKWGLSASLVFHLIGCHGESGSEPFVVSDSAGVRVVTNHHPMVPHVPELGPEVASIGGEGGFPFGLVRDAVMLDDHRIAVLDGLARTVYLFDSSGQPLDSLGGEGEGPGEFRRVSRLGAGASPGIRVFDELSQRVTSFPDGSSERSPSTWPVGQDRIVSDLAFVSDELAVVVRGSFREVVAEGRLTPGYHPTPGEVILLDWASGHEVALHEGIVSSFTYLSGNRVSSSPFAHRVRVGANDRHVVIGVSDGFSLRRYDLAGRLLQEVRYPSWIEPVRSAELDSLRERHRRLAASEGSPFLEGIFEPDAQPERRPSFGRMLVSEDDWIWVGSFSPNSGTPTSWAIFDPEGRLRNVLSLPPDTEPLWIGRDHVLLRHTDELGVHSIHVHDLRF